MSFAYDIREATEDDIPGIVDLLQTALPDATTSKSEPYWRWKHVDNPFGPSIVLIAEDSETPVGLRAFMQWRWEYGETVYRALRAVDTATHPDYRRRGIFSTLTSRAVERSLEKGFDFIFNTPNKKSRPGYLKLGWKKWHRVPLGVRINRPLSILWNRFFGNSEQSRPSGGLSEEAISAWFDEYRPLETDHCSLPFEEEYFLWRYAQCPVVDYQCSIRGSALMFYYLKDTAYGRELRICDWLWNDHITIEALRKQLNEVSEIHRPAFTSLHRTPSARPLVHALGMWNATRFAPLITLRALNREIGDLPPVSNWALTTGAMELF